MKKLFILGILAMCSLFVSAQQVRIFPKSTTANPNPSLSGLAVDGFDSTYWMSTKVTSCYYQVNLKKAAAVGLFKMSYFSQGSISFTITAANNPAMTGAVKLGVFAPNPGNFSLKEFSVNNSTPYTSYRLTFTLDIPYRLKISELQLFLLSSSAAYDLKVYNDLKVYKSANIDTLIAPIVYGNTRFTSNVTVAGISKLWGNTTIGMSRAQPANLIVNGSSTLYGNTTISGTKTNSVNLTVNGDIIANSISGPASGNLTFSGGGWLRTSDGAIHFPSQVGIGGADCPNTDTKLAVKGNTVIYGHLYVEHLKIQVPAWADFVFNTNHKLSTLSETETYIKTHGHLEGVPSATDVKENGIDVAEMNKILLQKIEEMTLLMIEQDKAIQTLKAKIEVLQKQ
jgi:hypothetical protein